MIEIRKATHDDASLLASISSETFYDTYAEFNTKADMDLFLKQHFDLEILKEEINKSGQEFWFLFLNNDLAGYIFLKENSHTDLPMEALEIARIYARKKYIGKGLGKKLMQTAIDQAKQKHKKVIWLGVWKQNPNAIQFYQKQGFEIFAEHTFLLGNDLQEDWVMKLNVANF